MTDNNERKRLVRIFNKLKELKDHWYFAEVMIHKSEFDSMNQSQNSNATEYAKGRLHRLIAEKIKESNTSVYKSEWNTTPHGEAITFKTNYIVVHPELIQEIIQLIYAEIN